MRHQPNQRGPIECPPVLSPASPEPRQFWALRGELSRRLRGAELTAVELLNPTPHLFDVHGCTELRLGRVSVEDSLQNDCMVGNRPLRLPFTSEQDVSRLDQEIVELFEQAGQQRPAPGRRDGFVEFDIEGGERLRGSTGQDGSLEVIVCPSERSPGFGRSVYCRFRGCKAVQSAANAQQFGELIAVHLDVEPEWAGIFVRDSRAYEGALALLNVYEAGCGKSSQRLTNAHPTDAEHLAKHAF